MVSTVQLHILTVTVTDKSTEARSEYGPSRCILSYSLVHLYMDAERNVRYKVCTNHHVEVPPEVLAILKPCVESALLPAAASV